MEDACPKCAEKDAEIAKLKAEKSDLLRAIMDRISQDAKSCNNVVLRSDPKQE